jgi:gluconate 2-dehydrogenase gamma chain
MEPSRQSRREFVASSAGAVGGGWLWLQLPVLGSLAACARDAGQRNDDFTTFTAAEGSTLRAMAARILPAVDGLPGAEEAGAAWFVDLAVAGPFADALPVLREGLADLDARARERGGRSFAGMDADAQDAVLGDVADSPFFRVARLLVIAGVLCDPERGGNRGHAGYTLLGMEHAAAFPPPFGWYDAEPQRGGGA